MDTTHRRYRWRAWIIAVACSALVLSACGGDADGADDTTDDEQDAAQQPVDDAAEDPADADDPADQEDPDGDVTLNWILAEQPEIAQAVIDGFHESQDRIRVEQETYPFREYMTQVEVRLGEQDSTIDVVNVDQPLVASYGLRGYLEPLGPYLDEEWRNETWLDIAHEGGMYGDEMLAAPLQNSSMVMYVNLDLFEEAGVEPPPGLAGTDGTDEAVAQVSDEAWTWEEAASAAEQIVENTEAWGLVFQQPRPFQLIPLGQSLGARAIDESGLQTDGYLNSDEWVRVAEFWYDIHNTSEISPVSMPAEETNENFLAGNVAMLIGGVQTVEAVGEPYESGDLNLDIAAHPYFEDGEPVNVSGSWHVGISAYSEQKDAAAEFIEFFSGPEGSRLWAEATGRPPTTRVVLDELMDAPETAEFPATAYRLALHESETIAQPRPQTPGWLEFEDILTTAMEDMRQGADPQGALDGAVTRIDRELQKYAQ